MQLQDPYRSSAQPFRPRKSLLPSTKTDRLPPFADLARSVDGNDAQQNATPQRQRASARPEWSYGPQISQRPPLEVPNHHRSIGMPMPTSSPMGHLVLSRRQPDHGCYTPPELASNPSSSSSTPTPPSPIYLSSGEKQTTVKGHRKRKSDASHYAQPGDSTEVKQAVEEKDPKKIEAKRLAEKKRRKNNTELIAEMQNELMAEGFNPDTSVLSQPNQKSTNGKLKMEKTTIMREIVKRYPFWRDKATRLEQRCIELEDILAQRASEVRPKDEEEGTL
ncbi:hypothetical protein BT63DRAFT_482307 [Microthyrium microscopicum]|uniref:Uncharacterized protein n=1 Tax=Microthyrium microscopicum TaxID=703497 RepID=A0A6A6U1P1_9PEZI|nr:hypothetical protein BT63DRAFT_482307 [Microthyrium microscopicum]